MDGIRIAGRGIGRPQISAQVTDSAVYLRVDDPDHPEFWQFVEISLPALLGWVVLSADRAGENGTSDAWAATARAAGLEQRNADGEVIQ